MEAYEDTERFIVDNVSYYTPSIHWRLTRIQNGLQLRKPRPVHWRSCILLCNVFSYAMYPTIQFTLYRFRAIPPIHLSGYTPYTPTPYTLLAIPPIHSSGCTLYTPHWLYPSPFIPSGYTPVYQVIREVIREVIRGGPL